MQKYLSKNLFELHAVIESLCQLLPLPMQLTEDGSSVLRLSAWVPWTTNAPSPIESLVPLGRRTRGSRGGHEQRKGDAGLFSLAGVSMGFESILHAYIPIVMLSFAS